MTSTSYGKIFNEEYAINLPQNLIAKMSIENWSGIKQVAS